MSHLTDRTIFVFGSNEAGRHGRGSALEAVQRWGAVYGCGTGLQGNSYAIPTKDENLKVLSIETIKGYVKTFIEFAYVHPTWTFNVVAIGCGLAGYHPEQIAPIFQGCPSNVQLPQVFLEVYKRAK